MERNIPSWVSLQFRRTYKPTISYKIITQCSVAIMEEAKDYNSFEELIGHMKEFESKTKNKIEKTPNLSLNRVGIENDTEDAIIFVSYLDKTESTEEYNERIAKETEAVFIWEYFNENARTKNHIKALLSLISIEKGKLHKAEEFEEMSMLEKELNEKLQAFVD